MDINLPTSVIVLLSIFGGIVLFASGITIGNAMYTIFFK